MGVKTYSLGLKKRFLKMTLSTSEYMKAQTMRLIMVTVVIIKGEKNRVAWSRW